VVVVGSVVKHRRGRLRHDRGVQMLAILDIQHAGKPGKNDLGASHDLDGDGVIGTMEHEAELTPIYAAAAREYLIKQGAAVVILTAGSYASRHKKASTLAKAHAGPVAYVACHLNAGGGDYSLVVHDYRSGTGATLATSLSRALRKRLKPLGVPRGFTGRTGPPSRPSNPPGLLWDAMPTFEGSQMWPRAWVTLAGVYDGPVNISGVCFEPCFMDSHSELCGPDGLEVIGRALAGGLLAYFARVDR